MSDDDACWLLYAVFFFFSPLRSRLWFWSSAICLRFFFPWCLLCVYPVLLFGFSFSYVRIYVATRCDSPPVNKEEGMGVNLGLAEVIVVPTCEPYESDGWMDRWMMMTPVSSRCASIRAQIDALNGKGGNKSQLKHNRFRRILLFSP